ncbi:uncharacterized protein LOC143559237 [Bidens hawaiensis]|uniref:uncharacterized protein LOC143559237 n=1 Tax=Bidens hawaiensis TaxID=980011 RepID=UPI00404B08EC
MAVISKCRNFFSLFSKQRKPLPEPQPPSSRSPPPPSPPPPQQPSPIDRNMGASQALKRIPLIKFPQRHPKPSGSVTQTQAKPAASNDSTTFFSKPPSEKTLGGKASLQPKRTPMTQEEIDAILLGGCL